jgi:hypothetical protein
VNNVAIGPADEKISAGSTRRNGKKQRGKRQRKLESSNHVVSAPRVFGESYRQAGRIETKFSVSIA